MSYDFMCEHEVFNGARCSFQCARCRITPSRARELTKGGALAQLEDLRQAAGRSDNEREENAYEKAIAIVKRIRE